jgi:hypothetical protein
LSENAGYDAARERQGMLEARISIGVAHACSTSSTRTPRRRQGLFRATGAGRPGARRHQSLQSIRPDEADGAGAASPSSSPVGRALLGKAVATNSWSRPPRARSSTRYLHHFCGSIRQVDSRSGPFRPARPFSPAAFRIALLPLPPPVVTRRPLGLE